MTGERMSFPKSVQKDFLSSDDETKPTSFKETLKNLAESSSLHGIPKIVTSRQLAVKVLWCLLFVGTFSIFTIQLYNLFKTFYSYPVQTTVSLSFNSIAFPAITLCNMNPVKSSFLNQGYSQQLNDILSSEYTVRKKRSVKKRSANPKISILERDFDINDAEPYSNYDGSGDFEHMLKRQTTDIMQDATQQDISDNNVDYFDANQEFNEQQHSNVKLQSSEPNKDLEASLDNDHLEGLQHRWKRADSPMYSTKNEQQSELSSSNSFDTQAIRLSDDYSTSTPFLTTAPVYTVSSSRLAEQSMDMTLSVSPSSAFEYDGYEETGSGSDSGRYKRSASGFGYDGSGSGSGSYFDGSGSGSGSYYDGSGSGYYDYYDYWGSGSYSWTQYYSSWYPYNQKPTNDKWDARVNQFKVVFRNVSLDVRKEIGHQKDDMFQSATFAGRVQNVSYFQDFTSVEYGNCYTIASPKYIAWRSGPSHGLKLTLNVEIDEYVPNFSTGYGIRIVFHEPGTYPLPYHKGITLSPGTETNIGLKMVRISRLGEPHGNCIGGEEFERKYNKRYSIAACYEFCRIQKTVKECNCIPPEAPDGVGMDFSGIHVCNSTDREDKTCVRRIDIMFDDGEVACDCRQPCSENAYQTTLSSTYWPTDDYLDVLVTEMCETNKSADIWSEFCRDVDQLDYWELDRLRYNFLRVLIYFEDLNYETITEEPLYESVRFLSDIGGAMGLFMGASVLSFVEIMQLILEIFLYFKRKYQTGSIHTTEVMDLTSVNTNVKIKDF